MLPYINIIFILLINYLKYNNFKRKIKLQKMSDNKSIKSLKSIEPLKNPETEVKQQDTQGEEKKIELDKLDISNIKGND